MIRLGFTTPHQPPYLSWPLGTEPSTFGLFASTVFGSLGISGCLIFHMYIAIRRDSLLISYLLVYRLANRLADRQTDRQGDVQIYVFPIYVS